MQDPKPGAAPRRLLSPGVNAGALRRILVSGKLYRENKKHDLRFASVQFEGALQVKDPARLLEVLQVGIGSGKGLGFGLLSLALYRG
jgi:CRISPR-associated protein Cas6/Cse3/CasE subtype I-E